MSEQEKETQETTVEKGAIEDSSETTASTEVETENSATANSPADLEHTIEALTDENTSLKDKIARLQAEMENTRRRSQQEVEKARKFGMTKLVEDLVPVLDSLDLGQKSIEEHSDDIAKAKEGYEMIVGMFSSIMEKSGVKVIDPQGEAFDPECHQAMTTEATNDIEPNHVLRVFQKGYRLNERLVRPAMVVISVASSVESDKNPTQENASTDDSK